MNSYCDSTYADAYINPLNNDAWNGLNHNEKARYLLLAKRYIDHNYRLKEEAFSSDHLKQATCEVALVLLDKGLDYLFGNIKDKADISKFKASSVEMEFEQGSQVQAPKILVVDNLLKGLVVSAQGASMAKLVRG